MPVHDYLGILGVGLVLLAYYLLQIERVKFDDYLYLGLNGFGALMIVISLLFAFNLAAMIIESAWVLISVYGLARRCWRA